MQHGYIAKGAATWSIAAPIFSLPITSRSRTVVRLPLPHARSGSVNALRQRKHQNRRLYSTNSTPCSLSGTSRLLRGRTSCCLTHMLWQCVHLARSVIPITSIRIVPSGCTSCLRIRSPSHSHGTTIPCSSWFDVSSVICCLGITCLPVGLVSVFLPSLTKDKLFSQFSPTFTLKDGEPEILRPLLFPRFRCI